VEASVPDPDGGTKLIRVADGVAGAAVLALMRTGTVVDEAVFSRIHRSLASLGAE
jgi:hypothetical protein